MSVDRRERKLWITSTRQSEAEETEVIACGQTVIYDQWWKRDDPTSRPYFKVLFLDFPSSAFVKEKNPLSPCHRQYPSWCILSQWLHELKALKVKAVHAHLPKQPESRCFFFSGFPPSLPFSLILPLWSRSMLIGLVRLLVACWNMPWLVVLPEWSRERDITTEHREWSLVVTTLCWCEGTSTLGELCNTLRTNTAAGVHPLKTTWRRGRHPCRAAAWWVYQLCLRWNLWHFCHWSGLFLVAGRRRFLPSITSETLISAGKIKKKFKKKRGYNKVSFGMNYTLSICNDVRAESRCQHDAMVTIQKVTGMHRGEICMDTVARRSPLGRKWLFVFFSIHQDTANVVVQGVA